MNDIAYELVRSRRKTLALTIDAQARLIVRAPMLLGENIIRGFIRKKARWIVNKQRQIQNYRQKHRRFMIADGENVLFLGKSYAVIRKDIDEAVIEGNFLAVPKSMDIGGFAKWMKAQAKIIICERVDYYANLMGAKYTWVKMSDARCRWGSCGAKNTLNFAWRLIMCPQFAIDYVAVHELSHIPHKNHGKEFWMLVASVMPNYKEAQNWFKMNRAIMGII